MSLTDLPTKRISANMPAVLLSASVGHQAKGQEVAAKAVAPWMGG